MSIFRAYDIRGIVGETLTMENVVQIGQAVGSEASARQQDTVVVGRDGRLSGPDLISALKQGLMKAGRKVVDVGMVPTPVLYFSTFHLNTGSGVQLTGSHNPPNYNGLKIMLGNDTLFGESIQDLKRRIDERDLVTGDGSESSEDVKAAYLQRIVDDVKLQRPFKVVVDCGNGVGGELAPQLYKQLGCEVIELFCDIDGNFPNHHPDPSKPKNLEDLIQAVKEHDADLGFAFDGDADRLGVVDKNGQVIWPDRQMILYATDILKRNPGGEIIYDVKCSRHLGSAITAAGGRATMWKTGHSFIKTKIKESGALLGGEMSGHIFFKERWYGFDDALYTGARLLEILSQDQRMPTEVFTALPNAVNTPELNLQTEEGENFRLMEEILKSFAFDDANVATIDGLRADFQDGWGLVRPSNTTPCLVMRFEADNQAALDRIQGQFRERFQQLDASLELPF